MNLYYASLKLILKIYQTLLPQNCRVFGADRIPPGAKVIVANHPNSTDTFHLAFVVQEQIHTLIKGDFFSTPVLGWLLLKSGQIPVYTQKKQAALLKACEYLANGEVIVIYPEAQMNPENKRLKGKAGAIRMSLISGAPVVPLGIYVPENCTRTLTVRQNERLRQGRWQTCGHCYLYFGEPWLPSDECHGDSDDALVYTLTDQLMGKIYELSRHAYQEWLVESSSTNRYRILQI